MIIVPKPSAKQRKWQLRWQWIVSALAGLGTAAIVVAIIALTLYGYFLCDANENLLACLKR